MSAHNEIFVFEKSGVQFFGEQFVHHLRVCLALGLFHDLPDQRADGLLVAALVVLDRLCIRGDDVLDDLLDLLGIGDLDEPLILDDFLRCVGRCLHLLEHGFADLRGNRSLRYE